MKNLLGITIFLVISGISQSVEEEKCFGEPRDLFFLVDRSGSINSDDFTTMRTFLSKLVSSVLDSSNGTRIGFLEFSTEEHTEIKLNLDNNYDAKTIRQIFENMSYDENNRRTTATHFALKMAAEEVFTKSGGDRPNVPDIAMVITDGQSNDPTATKENAQLLKEMGVRVIAIGVLNNLQHNENKEKIEKELNNIASGPEDKKIIDFDELETIVRSIVTTVCRNFTTPKPTRPPLTGCSGSKGKDILFVLDGTANSRQPHDLAEQDFRKIKGFMKAVIRGLDNDKFRIGVMQYSDRNTAKMDIDFTSFQHLNESMIQLDTIGQHGGYKRFTGDALVEASNKLYEHNFLEHRWDNPEVIVLITRGMPHDHHVVKNEAISLKWRNVSLITVGIHSGTSDKYLKKFLLAISEFTTLGKYSNLEENQTESVLNAICNPIRPGRVPCRPAPYDIFFVVDGSSSIKSHNFLKVKHFLLDMIATLSAYSHLHTGLMQFSIEHLTTVEWNLGQYSKIESDRKIRNMKYQAGQRTEAGDALTRVANEVFTGRNGDRPGVGNVLILVTDGDAHDLITAKQQASILKKMGVFIITIGAGTEKKLQSFSKVLSEIASSPEFAKTVNFEDLESFVVEALALVCKHIEQK